jgi:MoxR-like ATPase
MTLKYLPWNPEAPQVDLPEDGLAPAGVHVFDLESVEAINAALAAERPLLVRGEPGSGKSQLARAAAVALGRPFLSAVIDARTEARDLFYTFDAVERLAEAQLLGASQDLDRSRLAVERFLTPGPLWWAFDWGWARRQAAEVRAPEPTPPDGWEPGQGVVLLIDEIDKADSSVPNGLLEALGQGRFTCPGGKTVAWQTQARPLVVITTNEERTLPDAFQRRCLVLQLSLPDDQPEELVAWLMERGKAHFPSLGETILRLAAQQLAQDRAAVKRRGLMPPGGAEYLDLLRALQDLAPGDVQEQERLLARLKRLVLDKHAPDPSR